MHFKARNELIRWTLKYYYNYLSSDYKVKAAADNISSIHYLYPSDITIDLLDAICKASTLNNTRSHILEPSYRQDGSMGMILFHNILDYVLQNHPEFTRNDLYKRCIAHNPKFITYIISPSEELQRLAIQDDKSVIRYIVGEISPNIIKELIYDTSFDWKIPVSPDAIGHLVHPIISQSTFLTILSVLHVIYEEKLELDIGRYDIIIGEVMKIINNKRYDFSSARYHDSLYKYHNVEAGYENIKFTKPLKDVLTRLITKINAQNPKYGLWYCKYI